MDFTEPAMRPPQESGSLLLRATQGCTYNECRFCYVSRGYPFMAVTPEQLERELLAHKPFFPADTAVYLTGSNPFALPAARLRDYVAVLRRHFPRFARVSMQSRIADIAGKSDGELRELCGLGLSHLYIGTENGNDAALARMNKGHTAAQAVEQALRLKEAGMTYTLFYIIGMGGRGTATACGEDTARMFNQARPERITSTGMTIFAGTPLAEMVRRGEFVEASEREKMEELLVFLRTLNVDTFYDGIHYLNPLNYRFAVGDAEAKRQVLEDIGDVLRSHTDEELELMVGRYFKRSL
ncbi:radical SAM protein [uncultured Desulfovibrio sp.]|uniref:radical SAM protein n=1 Tax=uncultured Desulfovibrio sp. TaxID=167968 RepID=UPI002611D232|nr:radical SAM protein [uncultured Desulfovibrio sp.]